MVREPCGVKDLLVRRSNSAFCSFLLVYLFTLDACGGENITKGKTGDNEVATENEPSPQFYTMDEFVMGVDLSYVNQILDHGGVYRDSESVKDPYQIFSDYGTNVVRVRLWHDPEMTMKVYGESATRLYSNFQDVAKSIARAKQQGMAAALDFHYSDFWADPGWHEMPEAWKEIKDIAGKIHVQVNSDKLKGGEIEIITRKPQDTQMVIE